MILKKPYAFFIRFFKLFHLILFFMCSVLLYRTSLLYNFMKEFVINNPNVIGKDLVGPLFPIWIYFLLFIIFVINLVIINILVRKVKPFLYYIINMILYISVLVIYILSRNVITDMQSMLVTMKTAMAIRDLLNLCRLFQTISIVFYLIRATGFDIKKFDFVKDLQSLDISVEDSEEYEVSLDFDSNVIRRNIKRVLRDYKYYYYENKFLIILFSLIFVCCISLFVYFGFNKYDKVYRENEFFSVKSYNLGVKSSYIVSKDIFGKSIVSDEFSLVVVKLSIKGNSSTFPFSRAALLVDNVRYYHSNYYSSSLSDLGNVYNNQTVGNEFSDYLFIYKIPKDKINSSMQFRYVDNIEYSKGKTKSDVINVSLNPLNLDTLKHASIVSGLGEDIIYAKNKINILSADINNSFSFNYNSCVNSSECHDFKEILVPGFTSNSDKVLLKLEGTIEFDGKKVNLFNIFKQYGSIEYSIGENSFTEFSDFSLVSPVKVNLDNTYFIEVDKKIMDADKIKITFNTRDAQYSYVLRGDING